MATELTSERNKFQVRAAFAVIGILVLAMALTGWRALTASSGAHIVKGVVSVVSAQGTKFCFTPETGEDWCGRLATSGSASVAVGQKVTVLVSTVDADPGGTLSIGTVVPAEFSVK